MNTKEGYIHLYTGNGKGKTTAAIGLAIRAVGAGKTVFIAQFIKGMPYSEFNALKRFPEIEIKQYGLDCFIVNEPTQRDIDAARVGLKQVETIVLEHAFDIVVMDEVCIALHYNLFELKELVTVLKLKPIGMEIIMTGRYASQALYEEADLVTEMKEIKHYFNMGVGARPGIEY